MESWQAYIRDVLGVQSWIRPHVEVTEKVESSIPKLGIARNPAWTPHEAAFVDKILAATQLGPVSETSVAVHLISFNENDEPHRVQNENQIVWNLGSLQKLMTGEPQQVQQAKREVWNLLKRLKEEISV